MGHRKPADARGSADDPAGTDVCACAQPTIGRHLVFGAMTSTGSHDDARDAPGDPWDRYAQAVVEVALDDALLVLTPQEGPAPAPASGAEASAPVGGVLDGPVAIVTACDPFPESLTAEENAVRTSALVAALDAAGARHLPALGRSPDHRESEVSRAVLGLDRAAVLAVAAAFAQLAVFEIDGSTIACVAVADGTVMTRRRYVAELRPAGGGSAGPDRG